MLPFNTIALSFNKVNVSHVEGSQKTVNEGMNDAHPLISAKINIIMATGPAVSFTFSFRLYTYWLFSELDVL